MDHGDVGGWPLLPANQDSAEAVHPTMRTFDNPASRPVTSTLLDGLGVFAPQTDVRSEAKLLGEVPDLVVVVALVEAEVLRFAASRLGAPDDDVKWTPN